jgi:hypothetical protein
MPHATWYYIAHLARWLRNNGKYLFMNFVKKDGLLRVTLAIVC